MRYLAAVLVFASAPVLAEKPVTFQDVPGSTVKRITLTPKAEQRLGIETGKVAEQRIVRRQTVGGLVVTSLQVKQAGQRPVDNGFGSFGRPAPAPAPALQRAGGMPQGEKEAWVLLTLSPAEWERLAKDRPARLRPLETREKAAAEILARPSGLPPVDDAKRAMLGVYYVVAGADHGLEPNRRMRVELELDGGDEVRKVVPYRAVYYDAKGVAWVYLNPQPQVYQRSRIGVERISGEFAVLREGPDVGTAVVTVGAPLLYGTEIFKK